MKRAVIINCPLFLPFSAKAIYRNTTSKLVATDGMTLLNEIRGEVCSQVCCVARPYREIKMQRLCHKSLRVIISYNAWKNFNMQFTATMAENGTLKSLRIERHRDLSMLDSLWSLFPYVHISRLRDLIIPTNITCPLSDNDFKAHERVCTYYVKYIHIPGVLKIAYFFAIKEVLRNVHSCSFLLMKIISSIGNIPAFISKFKFC